MANSSDQFKTSTDYQLLDFGDGRKLESFQGWIVDRPCPAAEGICKAFGDLWDQTQSRFSARTRSWSHRDGIEQRWQKTTIRVDCGAFWMPVAPTPFGHVGLFPEQRPNWQWLEQTSAPPEPSCRQGLNLFAYTGASTLAMAMSRMRVVHVDAAKPNVVAAKNVANQNGLGEHPIRYLVDDAPKFVARELRRKNCYHTIVLDPPSYGHGPSGRAWRMQRDLWPLVDQCLDLLDADSGRLLITDHSHQIGAAEVLEYLREKAPSRLNPARRRLVDGLDSGRLELIDQSQRRLDAGFFVRFAYDSAST